MKVRVEPYGTDVARTLPLKMKESELALMGGASGTCVSYGIAEFSAKEWGPQPLRQVWRGMNVYTGLVTRGNSGIKHPGDLQGKRIPLVPGWPAGMKGIEGVMAFGNVNWDDVTKVTCSGYTDQLRGVMEGKVDVAYAATITPLLEEMAANPHGLAYITMPHKDKEGWLRLSKISPWFVPMVVQEAPGLENGKSLEYSGHPYSLWAYDHVDDAIIYEVVKALHKGFAIYKDMHHAMPHWNIHQAVTNPSHVPYHNGAIRYFKEAGVWTSAMDEWQANQVKLFNARSK
jgi:TRAP transporter TAXI family solute receptor